MSFEEKVKEHKEISLKIRKLEEERKLLSQELLMLMPKNMRVVTAGDYQVKRFSRITFKTTVEEARTFDAVRMEEGVDKDRLKHLPTMGHPIPGLT